MEVHSVLPPDNYKTSHSPECREKTRRLPFERKGNESVHEIPTSTMGNIYKLRFDPSPNYSESTRA